MILVGHFRLIRPISGELVIYGLFLIFLGLVDVYIRLTY